MIEGPNTISDGEEVFYVGTPSAGLWSTEAKLHNPSRRDLVDGWRALGKLSQDRELETTGEGS
jgi:hypothetical protein